MLTRIALALFILIVSMSQPVYAKAPTAQVTITGPKLVTPLHASDSAVTAANVWAGNFIDWGAGIVGLPRADALVYRVHFWVQLGPNDIQIKYVLNYQWLEDSNRAIVCLPGRRDIWYRINVYTILRDGQDGNCYYADEKWGRAVNAALRQSF